MAELLKRRGWLVLAACVVALVLPCVPVAGATVPSNATVTTFPQPRTPPTGGAGPLIVGPDGNVWFTQVFEETYAPGEEPRYLPRIVRMNPLGEIGIVTEHGRGEGFALTADGSVWFTSPFGAVTRIAPNGEVDSFLLPETGEEFTSAAGPIVAGADGNVWLSAYRSPRAGVEGSTHAMIVRVTPGGEITGFDLPGAGGSPTRLTLGPDGNVWFTERIEDRVGWISPAGQIASFPLPRGTRPGNIAAGSDGALWFTEESDRGAMIGRISTSGEFRELPLGVDENLSAGALAAGPDGRIWFTLEGGAISRMSPQGRISRVPVPNTGITQIVTGPEGNIWYSAVAGPPCAPGDSGCGDGGYFEAGVIGRIEPAPLAIAIDGAKPARRGRWVKVRVSCLDGRAESICRGKLRLRAMGTVVARRGFRLGADSSRSFSVKLGREAQARLLRRRHLRIVFRATLVGGVGGESRRLSIKLPRRP